MEILLDELIQMFLEMQMHLLNHYKDEQLQLHMPMHLENSIQRVTEGNTYAITNDHTIHEKRKPYDGRWEYYTKGNTNG